MSVACRYFKQGCCRYGNNCRFSHDITQNYSYSGSNYDRYHVDNRKKNIPRNTADIDFSNLLDAIRDELKLVENSHMWPLTCFGMIKGSNVQGFNDMSPDEVHYEFYVAYKSGTVDQFRKNLSRLYNTAKYNRNIFINKTEDARNAIKIMMNKNSEEGTRPQNMESGFFSTNKSSVFALEQSNQQSSIFSNAFNIPSNSQINSFSFKAVLQQSETNNEFPNQTVFNLHTPPLTEETEMEAIAQNNSSFSENSVFQNFKFTKMASSNSCPENPVFQNPVKSSKPVFNNKFSFKIPNEIYPQLSYTKEEMDQFKSKRFTLGSIPLKPPPKDLC